VLKRRLGNKKQKMVFVDASAAGGVVTGHTGNVDTSAVERSRFCITDSDIMTLADYAIRVEDHYSTQAGQSRPMDMEWAKDGVDGLLYMVQARPETVASQKKGHVLKIYHLKEHSTVLAQGKAIGTRIGSGKVRVIDDARKLADFQSGEVLVADTTTPDWEPIMKRASAIVTNRGGRTCHAAIVARELGVPTIVGAGNATEVLFNGQDVTICCAEGEVGVIYAGELPFNIEHTDLGELGHPHTQIMMNLGDPDRAFSFASLPVDGIGLARLEFIINQSIKAHPMAMIHPEKLDHAARQQIAAMTAAYDSPADFFVRTLSEGVATIAASVYPKSCICLLYTYPSPRD